MLRHQSTLPLLQQAARVLAVVQQRGSRRNHLHDQPRLPPLPKLATPPTPSSTMLAVAPTPAATPAATPPLKRAGTTAKTTTRMAMSLTMLIGSISRGDGVMMTRKSS